MEDYKELIERLRKGPDPTEAGANRHDWDKAIVSCLAWYRDVGRDAAAAIEGLQEEKIAHHQHAIILQAENATLRERVKELEEVQKVWGDGFNWKDAFDASQAERCRLNIEVANLKRDLAASQAENQRMRETLKEIAKYARDMDIESTYFDIEREARAALEKLK